MKDTYQKVAPNQPLQIAARTWNGLLEAGQDFARRKLGGEGAPLGADPLNPAVRVLVRNDTGGDLAAGSILALGTPIISAADYPREVSRQPLFPGDLAAATTDAFAVTLAPIEQNDIGRAVIMGLVSCSVDVTDSTHTYATPKVGDADKLASASTGPARILWRESGSSGTKKALCLIEPSAPVSSPFDARLTTSSGGLWKFVALTLDGAGAETDNGAEVATYCASPKKIDGTTLANPVAGLRVRMLPSLQAGLYEFIPTGMAASGFPGLVSKDAQTLSGVKTFERPVYVNSTEYAQGLGTATTATYTIFSVLTGDYSAYSYDSGTAFETVERWNDVGHTIVSRDNYMWREAFEYATGSPTSFAYGTLKVGGPVHALAAGWASAGNCGLVARTGDYDASNLPAFGKSYVNINPEITTTGISGHGSYYIGKYEEHTVSQTTRPPKISRCLVKYNAGSSSNDITYETIYPGASYPVTGHARYAAHGFAIYEPDGTNIPTDGISTSSSDFFGAIFSGGILTSVPSNGMQPPQLADAAAGNSTLYYSTTANKLVYKDSGGTVNNLY